MSASGQLQLKLLRNDMNANKSLQRTSSLFCSPADAEHHHYVESRESTAMTVFKIIREALFGPDKSDTEYYTYVANELSQRVVEPGLWARALAESEYDASKARARYIALRVVVLKRQADSYAKAQADLAEFRSNVDVAYRKRDYATCHQWMDLPCE